MATARPGEKTKDPTMTSTEFLKQTITAPLGGYRAAASYVLDNNDASREQVAALCGVEVDQVPVSWDWSDHESLMG